MERLYFVDSTIGTFALMRLKRSNVRVARVMGMLVVEMPELMPHTSYVMYREATDCLNQVEHLFLHCT